jgi:hypothetical protein
MTFVVNRDGDVVFIERASNKTWSEVFARQSRRPRSP